MINLNNIRARIPKSPPAKVINSIDTVRTMIGRVHRTMVPKPVALLELITSMWTAQALSVAATLNLADNMDTEPMDCDTLGKKVGAKPEALYRLMRALTNIGLFEEMPGKTFRLTALGECLKADSPNSVKAMAVFQGQFQWQHWQHLLHSVKTGETAVEKVHNGKCLFDVMKTQPEVQKEFDIFMGNISAMEIGAILAAYSFENAGTVCDVGGGFGSMLLAVLEAHPNLTGILYDQPQVVKGALPALKKSDRCTIKGGDFFENVPAGAETYMMKHIIHDWEEKDCAKILGHIRKVIPESGKLILLETVITKPNVPHFSKLLDLEMLVAAGGMERTADEYRDLLGESGFRLRRVIPTASLASVIEAVPVR